MAREAIAFMRALRGLLRYEGSVSGARSTLPIQTHYMPREDSPGLAKLLPPEAARDNGGYVFDVPYSGMEALLATLLECGPGVAAGLSLERPSLHHVFVKLVGEETVERMKIEAEAGGRMISHFRQAAVIATPAFLVFLLAPLFMLVFALIADSGGDAQRLVIVADADYGARVEAADARIRPTFPAAIAWQLPWVAITIGPGACWFRKGVLKSGTLGVPPVRYCDARQGGLTGLRPHGISSLAGYRGIPSLNAANYIDAAIDIRVNCASLILLLIVMGV